MATVEYIRYRIGHDRRDAFEAAYRRAAVPLAASEYCVDYELTECEEEAGVYVLRIRWTSTKAHLEGFRASPEFTEFFAAIQPYVQDIEEMRHYRATGVVGEGAAAGRTDPTLYEYLGGAPALARLTEVFYAKVLADELLAPVFAGMDPEHPQHVALFLGEVLGGPPAYSAERGGHPHMISRHLGRALTEPMRRRWLWLLEDAADEVGLPTDPEFRAAFRGYLEWGTRMALLFSAPGAQRVVHTPMPAWGWGLTPPYRPEG
ncbi:group II truncated hemoglobin [Streptacidiphilus sp. MAP5-3]|uniref:group II truncated hemoglobin n=1 Tax=unclassified Streptacidiphilus TaxID=2643834 RepID=UPI003519651A